MGLLTCWGQGRDCWHWGGGGRQRFKDQSDTRQTGPICSKGLPTWARGHTRQQNIAFMRLKCQPLCQSLEAPKDEREQ